jgi:hypothetical protein
MRETASRNGKVKEGNGGSVWNDSERRLFGKNGEGVERTTCDWGKGDRVNGRMGGEVEQHSGRIGEWGK